MKPIDLMLSKEHLQKRKASIINRLSSIIDSGSFIMGEDVRTFEKLATDFTGAKHAIGCANGTDALTIALMASGVGHGDVVFTPSFTYVATAESIAILGAIPYFVDIDPVTFNICPESLKSCIATARAKNLPIKAIISVDLFGQPADPQLLEIANSNNLQLISDGAQSFGAAIGSARVGALAPITTTSFFPTKPLGCFGDGGMIFTNNADLAEKMRSICFHGKGDNKYHHVRLGMNSRLDSFQAAVLVEKMADFTDEIEARNQLARFYSQNLQSLITTPKISEKATSAWAVYNLRHQKRDTIIAELAKVGIPSNVYYHTPLHLQPAYSNTCFTASTLDHSLMAAREVFCLPMHAHVTLEQRQYIVDNMRKILLDLGSS